MFWKTGIIHYGAINCTLQLIVKVEAHHAIKS